MTRVFLLSAFVTTSWFSFIVSFILHISFHSLSSSFDCVVCHLSVLVLCLFINCCIVNLIHCCVDDQKFVHVRNTQQNAKHKGVWEIKKIILGDISVELKYKYVACLNLFLLSLPYSMSEGFQHHDFPKQIRCWKPSATICIMITCWLLHLCSL
jgi:hypothetical protein